MLSRTFPLWLAKLSSQRVCAVCVVVVVGFACGMWLSIGFVIVVAALLMKARLRTGIRNSLPASHRIKHVAIFAFSAFATQTIFQFVCNTTSVMILFLASTYICMSTQFVWHSIFVHCVFEMCQSSPGEIGVVLVVGCKYCKVLINKVHDVKPKYAWQSSVEAVRIYCFASMLFRFHYR